MRGYTDIVANLKSTFPLGEPIISEQQQKQFIALYNSFLKLRNILISFDDFQGREILSERDLQDYQGMYLALYEEFRKVRGGDTAEINDDVVFEMELVKQVEINIEYIMQLIHNYHDSNCNDKEILSDINRAIDSSVELRSKKDLIEQFVASLTVDSNVDEDWQKHIQRKRREELDGIIAAENLDAKKTYQLINLAFRDGAIPETGTNLTAILPPMSLFSKNNALGKKRETVLDKLKIFFNRFFDIAEGKM